VLLGRDGECEALERLLEGVGAGRSGALVVRGEPGVGKTALLSYLHRVFTKLDIRSRAELDGVLPVDQKGTQPV
jgi:predicted ATPase